MKEIIALINPPYRGEKNVNHPNYPLGLGYLKANCKQSEKIQIYDFSQSSLSDEELIDKYNLDEYKIIGITSFSIDFENTAFLIKKLKRDDNVIIVGGHHATQTGKKLLDDFEYIDYCMKGYGDISFPQLIDALLNDTKSFSNISGLVYRCNGSIIENVVNYSDLVMDSLIFPDRNNIIYDFDTSICSDIEEDTLTISSSRGCPYNCSFCVNCKNNYWLSRSVKNVIAEIDYCINNNEYKNISFVDCNFFVDVNRAMEILRFIHYKYPNLTISFQLRADQICKLDSELKELSAYNILVEVGIESASDDVLNRFHKMTTVEINQKALDILNNNNINYAAYMIMFDALETIDDIRKNFNFIKRNHIFSYQNIGNLYQTMFPFYGSEYYEKYGNYYTGSVHKRTVPVFVNKDVESLHNCIVMFRNEFEDRVNMCLKNSGDTELSNRLILFHYGIFEYLLIMAEKYGMCNYGILIKSKIYHELKKTISEMENVC